MIQDIKLTASDALNQIGSFITSDLNLWRMDMTNLIIPMIQSFRETKRPYRSQPKNLKRKCYPS